MITFSTHLLQLSIHVFKQREIKNDNFKADTSIGTNKLQ